MRKLYYVIATVTLFFLPIGVMLTAYSFIIWKLWINRVPGELSNTNNNSLHNRSKKKVSNFGSRITARAELDPCTSNVSLDII